MFKPHYLLIAASAFALSACLGSSNDTPRLDAPDDTPVEAMPTSGSASYSGAVTGIQGDGDRTVDGTMSMTANFAEGGGNISNARLTINDAEGAFTQEGSHDFTGNEYENLPLDGSVTFDGMTLTSNNSNRLLVGGTFRGDSADAVSANLGGRVDTSDGDAMDIRGGSGVLTAQPLH